MAPADRMTLERAQLLPLIAAALKEDVGPRDLTTAALIRPTRIAEAQIVVRQEGILAGLAVAEWTFAAANPSIRFKPMAQDGDRVYPGKAAAFLEGPARGLLAGERVALNFLGRLSGIATLTRAFVDQVRGTAAQIFDTRKTTPTLRLLERYAVSVGGGQNHRMGLYDQVLIKANHLRLLAGEAASVQGRQRRGAEALSAIEQAVARIRARMGQKVRIEVEVSTLRQFRQALSAQAQIILLDNMPLKEIQEAVRLRNAVMRSKGAPRILLEVSGGVTLKNVRAIAATGVERISVGALTHSAPCLDVALEVVR